MHQRHHGRPARPHLRRASSTPDRAALRRDPEGPDRLPAGKTGIRLRFTPLAPAPVIADLSPLHKEFQAISSLVNSQVLALDDQGNFNPTGPVAPAEVIYALKKILNAIEN